MECGIPFCHAVGCPVKNRIPEFNDLVYRDRWREAADNLHSTNNFPEITGRVCPAPCEAACTLALNDRAVNIKQIEYQIAERAFAEDWVAALAAESQDRPQGRRRRFGAGGPGRRPAIGPRGPRGGRLRERRPAGRPVALRHSRLQAGKAHPRPPPGANGRRGREVRARRQRGRRRHGGRATATIRCDPALHGSRPAARPARARGRFAGRPSCHGVSAAAEPPHRRAADARRRQPSIHAADKHVIVVGGGDTGSDCVGTAIRQEALSVTQLEILPRPPEGYNPETPWPFWPKIMRTSSSQEEGCQRRWSTLTKALSGDRRPRDPSARLHGRLGCRSEGLADARGSRARSSRCRPIWC